MSESSLMLMRTKVEAKIKEIKNSVKVVLDTKHKGSVIMAAMLTAKLEPYEWMLAEIDILLADAKAGERSE